MSDYHAIDNLLVDYCLTLDTGRIDDCAALFENAEFTFEGFSTVHGSEGVKGVFGNIIVYQDGTPRTRHLLTNVQIDVAEDGKSASSQSYLSVLQRADGTPLQPIFAGHYVDDFINVKGRWQFSRRYVQAPLFGDMSRHMRGM